LYCLQDAKSNLSRELLLHNHLIHWTGVRKKWHAASHINEARYNESGQILKAIYKRSDSFVVIDVFLHRFLNNSKNVSLIFSVAGGSFSVLYQK
jgi:hypothetical protein